MEQVTWHLPTAPLPNLHARCPEATYSLVYFFLGHIAIQCECFLPAYQTEMGDKILPLSGSLSVLIRRYFFPGLWKWSLLCGKSTSY